MASYLIQPDGSSACCDCSARSGPCDDCTTGGCPDPGCSPLTVSASVTFSVDDTESAGCSFHATKTETLFSGEVIPDICSAGAAWGPFEFDYPEYDNGQIFIGSISVGLTGSQVCIGTDGVCGVFFDCDEFGVCCGSGFFCFQINDSYMTGGTACTDGCGASTTFTWVNDDGTGFIISASLTITIS